MVEQQIAYRGVKNPRVIQALSQVPRQFFVPQTLQAQAFDDGALPIGEGQTISQPYIVGLMSELLRVNPNDRILEIGTGSGYQTAILAEMGARVFTIEIVQKLAQAAQERLLKLGYSVSFRCGDGYRGWPEMAPFDGIIITAAPNHIPPLLPGQLRNGGRLVLPLGDFRGEQELFVLTRRENGYDKDCIIPVRFVPLTGEAMRYQEEGV